MAAIRGTLRPKLVALGDDLTSAVEELTGIPTFPHVAQHMRRRVHPPEETWVAFARDRKGYKRWTHFRVAVSGAGVRVTLDGARVRVVAESAEPWPDGATASARLTGPDLTGRDVALERVSGTRFVGEAPASAAGTYAAGVSLHGPTGPLLSATATAVQSYSAEYRPGAADPEALNRLSSLAGGRGAIAPKDAFAAAGLRAGQGRLPLAGWFLLAAALLWPIAVALSRLALHGAVATAVRSGGRRVTDSVRHRLRRSGPRPPTPAPGSARRERERERGPGHGRRGRQPEPVAPPPTIDRLLRKKRGEPEPDGD
jgi:hypothetical protein